MIRGRLGEGDFHPSCFLYVLLSTLMVLHGMCQRHQKRFSPFALRFFLASKFMSYFTQSLTQLDKNPTMITLSLDRFTDR